MKNNYQPSKLNDYVDLKPNNHQFYHKFMNKNFEILIQKGNLLDQQVDIITNAANKSLILGGGVAGAILSKCGMVIQEECNRIIRKRGKLEVSESVHTTSHNMIDANYIIHAVGPRWDDYYDKLECYNYLKSTFYNILMYAENKLEKAQSIAIPLISSAIFGVPKNMCCKALYFAIEEYLTDSNDLKRNLKSVRLINIDDPTNDQLVEFFKEKFSRIDDYVEHEDKIDDSVEQKDRIDEEKILEIEQSDTEYKNLLNCRMCDNLVKLNEAKKFDCGCFYCIYCRENIEQGNECECKQRIKT